VAGRMFSAAIAVPDERMLALEEVSIHKMLRIEPQHFVDGTRLSRKQNDSSEAIFDCPVPPISIMAWCNCASRSIEHLWTASPAPAATHACSFNGPEPKTDHGLAWRPCLPVLVNHGVGVTSAQVVIDLCVILVHTFQFCE